MESEKLIKILKAVSNKNRFLILKLLRKRKEMSVGDLAEATNLPFRSVSRDLSILRKINLVQAINHYSNHIYSIDIQNFPKNILKLF